MIAAAIIGGYVFSSLLLFKFPTLLHKQKKLKFHCRHISHRGGAGENLENTICAYEHALKTGTQMLEIDLQLTKDGHVVVSHDNNLSRVAGQNLNISDLNYSELPELRKELQVEFHSGVLCKGKGEDRKIPLLKDVYEKFPNLPINIDIKTNNDTLIKKVSELTKQYNREHITVWGNASDIVTNKCYDENPEMPILFSSKRVMLLLVLIYTGLLPFFPLKESCLEIPFPRSIKRQPAYKELESKSKKLLFWVFETLLVRKSLFEHLEKRGIQIYVWVVNNEDDFDEALELGVSGIMTDYPTMLTGYLTKKKKIPVQEIGN